MSRILARGLCPLLTLAAAAQQYATIPGQAAARDGSGVGSVPGFDRGGRAQFLLGHSVLTQVAGRALNAITFRRDGFEAALGSGMVDLTVTLSISPLVEVRAPQVAFAANRGPAPVVVFQGRVTLPASPRLTQRDGAQWTSPDAVTVTFQRPWTYTGGHLCIEIAGRP